MNDTDPSPPTRPDDLDALLVSDDVADIATKIELVTVVLERGLNLTYAAVARGDRDEVPTIQKALSDLHSLAGEIRIMAIGLRRKVSGLTADAEGRGHAEP